MSETIIIRRLGQPTGAKTLQGKEVLAASTDISVDAIAVAPLQGDETDEITGTRAVNGYTLYLPFGTDIRKTDAVTIRGVDGWQVEADAGQVDWSSPFTSWQPGTVAIVRRAS